MSGYDPSPSFHNCTADEASSFLPCINSADSSPPRQLHDDNAGKQPCTRSNAALIQAVSIWREGIQHPLSTDVLEIIDKTRNLCLRPSYHGKAVKPDRNISSLHCSDGSFTLGEPSPCRAFPTLSKLQAHEPNSSGSDSGVDSTPDSISNRPDPGTPSESDTAANETTKTISALHSSSRRVNDVLLRTQSAVIRESVSYGEYLAALTQALRYSYDFTFQLDPREVFSARIHVFNLGKRDEVPGIMMRFHKTLHPGFKSFLARRLLNGVLIRYPKTFFPRTFCVAEGEAKPVVLHVYEAVRCRPWHRSAGGDCGDVIVRQWRRGARD